MTTPALPAEQYVDLGRRGQEAAVAAAEGYPRPADLRRRRHPARPEPVDPKAVTAAGFDLAEQLAAVQREFATTTVTLLTEAGETATAQASAAGETLKARTEEATERVIDLATETTRRAASAARNGVSV